MKIKEAVKLTGKSRTAILRALQEGKISGEKDGAGAWDIDPSELVRVYDVTIPEDSAGAHPEPVRAHVRGAHRTGGGAQGAHTSNPEILIENATLKVELDVMQRLADERSKTIEDLRVRLDTAEERRTEAEKAKDDAQTKLTALLTDQRDAAPTAVAVEPSALPRRTRAVYWIALGVALAVISGVGGVLVLAPELLLGFARSQ